MTVQPCTPLLFSGAIIMHNIYFLLLASGPLRHSLLFVCSVQPCNYLSFVKPLSVIPPCSVKSGTAIPLFLFSCAVIPLFSVQPRTVIPLFSVHLCYVIPFFSVHPCYVIPMFFSAVQLFRSTLVIQFCHSSLICSAVYCHFALICSSTPTLSPSITPLSLSLCTLSCPSTLFHRSVHLPPPPPPPPLALSDCSTWAAPPFHRSVLFPPGQRM